MVDDGGLKAVTVEWACVFLPAVACLAVIGLSGVAVALRPQNAFVVAVDNLLRVVHGAVADLYGVSVEYFSELVIYRKTFVY